MGVPSHSDRISCRRRISLVFAITNVVAELAEKNISLNLKLNGANANRKVLKPQQSYRLWREGSSMKTNDYELCFAPKAPQKMRSTTML